MKKDKKTIAIDFDGVIHKYSKGWHDGTVYDEPVDGAEEGLKRLLEEFNVYILTSREVIDVQEWMNQHINIPTLIVPERYKFWVKQNVLGISNRKLPAVAYIDDRSLQFKDWESLKKVLNVARPPRYICK